MPKSDLMSSVERIAERVAKKILKESKLFTATGTWAKILQDENRALKHRLEELEIRVKKLNNHGPTLVKPGNNDSDAAASPLTEPLRLSLIQIRKIRTARGFSQEQFAQLLGVSSFRYRKWENGHVAVPLEYEQKIREIRELKGMELRTRMLNAGIFQPAGRVQAASRKQTVPVSARKTAKQPKKQSNSNLDPQSLENIPVTMTSEQLRKIRAILKLSQQQIAKKLKINAGRYNNWETHNRKPPADFVPQILALLSKTQMKQFLLEGQVTEKGNSNTALRKDVIQSGPENTPIALTSEQLKEIRTTLKLSHPQIAEKLKIKTSRYHNWEASSRKPPHCFVEKILALLPESQAKKYTFAAENSPDETVVLSPESIQKIRKKLNLTLLQIAEALGVTRNRYKAWEYGETKLSPEFSRKIQELDLNSKKRKGK